MSNDDKKVLYKNIVQLHNNLSNGGWIFYIFDDDPFNILSVYAGEGVMGENIPIEDVIESTYRLVTVAEEVKPQLDKLCKELEME